MTRRDTRRVDAFIDLRSPYSFLALKPARAFAEGEGIEFIWWPFTTDFESAYGGHIEERSPRDVAKLKYLYMDCRRLAKQQGVIVRSTTKLWDASLASKAMLFARASGRLWEFCDPLLAAFWRREFDLESEAQVVAALAIAGLRGDEWRHYHDTKAQSELDAAARFASQLGVFGAPTFVYNNELFWGGDRLALLAESLAASGALPSISART